MELHEYMESRGITRDSITAEQERTRDRIEAYKLAQIRRLKDLTQASVAQSMGVSQTCIRARAWGVGFDEARHAEQGRREPRRKTGCKHRVSRSYRYACALKIFN